MSTTHTLKTIEPHFSQVVNGYKRFELRKNDRNFKSGDILLLKKHPSIRGEQIEVYVTSILQNFSGLKEGYCVMSIEII